VWKFNPVEEGISVGFVVAGTVIIEFTREGERREAHSEF
jgi:hypothetical protein